MKKTGNYHCASCDQLLTELNYLRDVEMKDKDETIYRACTLLKELINHANGGSINSDTVEWAQMFYNEHFIYREPIDEDPDSDDWLPF